LWFRASYDENNLHNRPEAAAQIGNNSRTRGVNKYDSRDFVQHFRSLTYSQNSKYPCRATPDAASLYAVKRAKEWQFDPDQAERFMTRV
jgi:hypothetical protein